MVVPDRAQRRIAIFGITGRVGSAVGNFVLSDGWQISGLTRVEANARDWLPRGGNIMRVDLDNESLIGPALKGHHGVFLMTDPRHNGADKTLQHGMRVVRACVKHKVHHIVFLSIANADANNGVKHFAAKAAIEDAIKQSGRGYTILRSAMFMENLTDTKYGAPMNWSLIPKVTGAGQHIPWVAIGDVGKMVARIFDKPATYAGHTLNLAGDRLTMDQARSIFEQTTGRKPTAVPAPGFLYKRMMGADALATWEWMKVRQMDGDPVSSTQHLPGIMNFADFLRSKKIE
jgi:uncharacterized protein YbjT (DUF2867 family)